MFRDGSYCEDYLKAICDYDFKNFSDDTYPNLYSYGEENLIIDGEDIY